ncbi:MAG: ribosome biogenesis GTP-binding protein YihA/YsxC [Acidaminococcales bacterium]|jgi:GTP-binding protein|nr:ribosome biogenesis GTP-binding protein YihA/YsxC [Acidaminococcales bacterium]
MPEQTWDIVSARYVISAVTPAQYPPDGWPEAAFIGRSNVGKSSLINSLCRRSRLAKVSGSPGKTRTINFFAAQAKTTGGDAATKEFFLVDLPGYGFAKASKADKAAWAGFIRRYVTSSPYLRILCQLIDIRHDLMQNDRECYEWLAAEGIPVIVALTKADKLSAAAAAAQKARLCRALSLDLARAVMYSAVKNTGRTELIGNIVRGL